MLSDQIVEHAYCRACPNPIRTEPVLDLGTIPLSGFLRPGEDSPHPPIPLVLRRCPRCTLVQLGHTTPRDWLYREGYWYQSGINEMMREELTDIVREMIEQVGGISASQNVLDIGANDGTLIRAYHTLATDQPFIVAVEPAPEFRERLLTCATEVITGFFPDSVGTFPNAVVRHVIADGFFTIITSVACFYDLDDPHAFVTEIARLLAPDGVWVLQVQDLRSMLVANAFDCICAEHLEYYSLHAIIQLLAPHGLVVTDVEPRAINGGSLRVTIRHGRWGRPSPRVFAWMRWEEQGRLANRDPAVFRQFAWLVEQTRQHVMAIIDATRQAGGTIDLYGASTKGNTLLGYWGLDRSTFRQAWERSPEKWGLETSSGRIPIVSEAEGRADPPALLVAAIWQFREAILRRETDYLRAGGRILFPLPCADLIVGGDE